MKDQYFGDVNDYRKYGLLRALQLGGDVSLLVAWMLTLDDGGPDGKLRSYLATPSKWSSFDPDLFMGLSNLLEETPPAVSLIEGSSLLGRAAYYSAVVPDRQRERVAWQCDLFHAAAGVDLVFVDSDNGIEVRSKPVGHKGSSKYVTWGDIEGLWKLGCSVLVYQHLCRERRQAFTERLVDQLRLRTGNSLVVALHTSRVLFLLAAQARHAQRFEDATTLLADRWNGQIRTEGLSNKEHRGSGACAIADAEQ